MPYLYLNAAALDQSELVGSHHCVALIQRYTNAPNTGAWHEGAAVRGNLSLVQGTAIATFVNGRYPNLSHGNHAAFYLSQDGGGIWVIDQWKGDPNKSRVTKRYIPFRGHWQDGTFANPSNNGDAFYVIE